MNGLLVRSCGFQALLDNGANPHQVLEGLRKTFRASVRIGNGIQHLFRWDARLPKLVDQFQIAGYDRQRVAQVVVDTAQFGFQLSKKLGLVHGMAVLEAIGVSA